MMICRVKLYIMADARPSPPPARPLLMEPTAWVAASMIIMMMIMILNMMMMMMMILRNIQTDCLYESFHDNYEEKMQTMMIIIGEGQYSKRPAIR